MINFLVKTLINEKIQHTTQNVEELLYFKEVYPCYLKARDSFKFAIQNGFLNRSDILQLKEMLNKALLKRRHLKDFRFRKYKNDAHEIYTKLQSKYLSKRQLRKLDKNINKIVRVKSKKVGTFIPVPNEISQP